jgi:hypothetical protein
MLAKQNEKQATDREKRGRQQRETAIGMHVMDSLGQPGDLHSVQVRPLWDDHYRVNVLVGVHVTSVRVAHSYFLVADGNGNIVESTPNITKQY